MNFRRNTLFLAIISTPALADPSATEPALEELLVIAPAESRTIDVNEALIAAPDPAQLLLKAPGANINGNGLLSGIPQYRGMYGPRVATTINGNAVAGAGPNAMDPPISYAAGQLDSLELYRGIAPVGVAQESIGGAIEAQTARADFGETQSWDVSGRVRADAQSVNGGYHVGGVVFAANQNHQVKLGLMSEAGDDARFPSGDILPSEYDRQRLDLGYALHVGRHQLELDYARNETGDSGTPALPMDIQWIDGDLFSATYRFAMDDQRSIEMRVYGSELDHGMTNYHLRQAPADGAGYRRNQAVAENYGFKLAATLADDSGQWHVGVDGFSETHDSDIDNPNNPMFFVVNFNEAEREVLGVFAERQQRLGDHWRAEFGLRANRVEMNSGEVNGTPAMMMPPAMMLRDNFNNADRRTVDNNVDAVARFWYDNGSPWTAYLGLARKTRSPSYVERYLWLPLQSTGGLADGFTYTGNLELDPEVAHEIEVGLDLAGSRLTLSPRVFFRDVQDYIQGTPSTLMPALMFGNMMNPGGPAPLQFNNVDARLYGFDMDWAWQLAQSWSLSGLLNYVRGERRDIDDNLYRIAPPNATIGLNYSAARWQARVESVVYAGQDDVSVTNGEATTPGYGVVNVNATWAVTPAVQLAAGIENLLDREYRIHTGGYNRAANPDIARGGRLPGYGVNGFLRVTYSF